MIFSPTIRSIDRGGRASGSLRGSTDAELVTLVVLQALLGFTSEARFLRYANTHLRGLFPYLPTQSGYNKRIRAAIGTLRAVIAHLVARTSSVQR